MEVPAPLRLACRLYQMAGLPVSLELERPSLSRILFAVACFCCYVILSVFNLYVLLTTPSDNGYELYSKLYWTLYPILCAVVTTGMAFRYKSFILMSSRVEYVRELMIVGNITSGPSMVWQVATGCLVALTLSSISLSFLTNIHEFIHVYNHFGRFDGVFILSAAQIILHVPPLLFFFATIYHSSLQYLTELRVIEAVRREMLPPAVEDGTTTTRRLDVPRCRDLLVIYCQAKRIRLETESWLHFPLCMVMFSAAWYFPILMSQYRLLGEERTHYVLTAYMTVGTVVKIGPICLNQLIDYRKSILMRQVSRKVVNTAEPDLKKALVKLFTCIRDKYPNSPDVLLDFNFSLLSILVDATILVVTTFY